MSEQDAIRAILSEYFAWMVGAFGILSIFGVSIRTLVVSGLAKIGLSLPEKKEMLAMRAQISDLQKSVRDLPKRVSVPPPPSPMSGETQIAATSIQIGEVASGIRADLASLRADISSRGDLHGQLKTVTEQLVNVATSRGADAAALLSALAEIRDATREVVASNEALNMTLETAVGDRLDALERAIDRAIRRINDGER